MIRQHALRTMVVRGGGIHLRPGHHWLFELGEADNGSSCEFTFNFLRHQAKRRSGIVYKDTRIYAHLEGYAHLEALRFKRWLHRMAEDASALTCEEWAQPRMLTHHSLLYQCSVVTVRQHRLFREALCHTLASGHGV